jgi:hypothetical protein
VPIGKLLALFLCRPWPDLSSSRLQWMLPRHTFDSPCYAPFGLVEASLHYKPKLCRKAPKVCMGCTKMCLSTTRQAKRPAREEEKKEEGWSNNYMGPYHVGLEISCPSMCTFKNPYINTELSFGQTGGSWRPDWSTLLDTLIA